MLTVYAKIPYYSIVREYYTREDKPDNYLNLMFLIQDVIAMGDKGAGKWHLHYAE